MALYKSALPDVVKDFEIVVNRGIPIPEPRAASNIALYNAAKGLEVGDSIDIPYCRVGIASNLARDTGYTFTQRKIGNILRIWRTK